MYHEYIEKNAVNSDPLLKQIINYKPLLQLLWVNYSKVYCLSKTTFSSKVSFCIGSLFGKYQRSNKEKFPSLELDMCLLTISYNLPVV